MQATVRNPDHVINGWIVDVDDTITLVGRTEPNRS